MSRQFKVFFRGNDELDGGEGEDKMKGGKGAVTFNCDLADTITDFNSAEGDEKIGPCRVSDESSTEMYQNFVQFI